MQVKIARKPNEPKYRNEYVLTADGYYGDMDYDFRLEESGTPQDIDFLLDGYDLLRKLKDDPELHYNENFDHPGIELVPRDNGDYLPSIQFYALTWYDAFGVPFNVEVCDEV